MKNIPFILCLLFLTCSLYSNQKNIELQNKKINTGITKVKFIFAPSINLKKNAKNLFFNSEDELAIQPYAASVRRGSGSLGQTFVIIGVIGILAGLLLIAGGVPSWYFSAIGLDYITYHPGIVDVRPIDGNMGWLYFGYYGGIVMLSLGPALLATGIIFAVIGAVFMKRRHAKLFYETDIKTASARMGMSFTF